MAGRRVTYLIGAGASANALPVVSGMNERMHIFLLDLKIINSNLHFVQDSEFDILNNLLAKISTHKTIDTYAKKLWYKKDNENYNLLKRFLTCYLLYEQTIKDPKSYIEYLNSGIKNDRKAIFKCLDERYDSFFASLLNQNRQLDNNVNIVSWNYDMQFELAISDFFQTKLDINTAQENLQVFPTNTTKADFVIDNTKSAIIKLNGTANFYDLTSQDIVFDTIYENFHDERFISVLFKILFRYKEGKNAVIPLVFAWEDDAKVISSRNIARKIIAHSHAIIIIGYSFPTFNREIDRQIFNGINPDSDYKIYIQAPEPYCYEIQEKLKSINEKFYKRSEVIKQVDQFFIPPEL